MLHRLKRLLFQAESAGGDAFTAEEAAHAGEMLRQQDEQLAHNTLKLGILFNAALLVIVPLLVPAAYRSIFYWTNLPLLVLDIAWTLFLHKQRVIRPWVVVVGGNLVLLGAFAHILQISGESGLDGAFVISTSALMGLASVLLVLSPFSNWLTPATAVGFFLLPVAFYPPRPETSRWLVIYAVALVFSCLIRHGQARRARRESVLEYRKREAEIRAAKVKFQRELELAREIQDSLAPPSHQATPEGVQVYCMQVKHERVAGDWMTVRRCADGSVILVIADATGKGMQAALVIHAIQSLWATTLDAPDFDAKSWLERVNQALFRLGEKQTHSATIGLAVLRGNRITYWSAGHLPLFMLLGKGHAMIFKPLLGRGNVLGIAPQLTLTPQYIDVAPTFALRIVMGSDGILPKGTLTLQRDVESLYDQVKKEGSSCLDRHDTGDDKTLIIVEKNLTEIKAA